MTERITTGLASKCRYYYGDPTTQVFYSYEFDESILVSLLGSSTEINVKVNSRRALIVVYRPRQVVDRRITRGVRSDCDGNSLFMITINIKTFTWQWVLDRENKLRSVVLVLMINK